MIKQNKWLVQQNDQVAAISAKSGARRGNKLKKINQIYENKFRMIPFFLRDFTSLFDELDVKVFPPDAKIFD